MKVFLVQSPPDAEGHRVHLVMTEEDTETDSELSAAQLAFRSLIPQITGSPIYGDYYVWVAIEGAALPDLSTPEGLQAAVEMDIWSENAWMFRFEEGTPVEN